MIIAFWSNVHGQPGTTSNMISVASAITMEYSQKCLVTQTHFNMNNLESYFVGNDNNRDIFMDMGLDGLASVIKLRALDKSTIENYSIPLIPKQLTMLPGTYGENRKVFLDDIGRTITLLLSEIDKYYDLVFIDVNSGYDEITKMVMEKADIIVINLCQNKNILDNYKTTWQLFNKKTMYLIGRYDKASYYNLHNLKLLYKQLSKELIGVIPYNTGYMDAQSDGNVLKFIKKNINIKEGSNRYFIECVIEAAGQLMKLAAQKKGGM